jgi:monovalent cation:H+ antiporter-2, CPA2 family
VELGALFTDIVAFLFAVVVLVPLCGRLGAGPVLAYLAAGVLLGPNLLAVIGDAQALGALGEIGVLFLLFTIGLDLSLPRLLRMRREAFGLGGAQFVLSAAVIGIAVYAMIGSLEASILVGAALALSSTALVLQLLSERGDLGRRYGRAALAVLLFQDLAVVPILVMIPLLGSEQHRLGEALLMAGGKAALAIGGIILVGRYLLRPAYRLIGSARSADVLLAATLVVALGTSWATAFFGLSMVLGAFLAGVLIAETEYRHQVEADIRPFRGLLLGLFFFSVGASLNLQLLVDRAPQLIVLAAAVVATKAAVLFPLARLFKMPLPAATHLSLLLAQASEFCFVVIGLALHFKLLEERDGTMLLAVVALTMFATPALAALGRYAETRLARRGEPGLAALADESVDLSGHVVIAGFGRVGRIVAQVLALQEVPYIALDLDPRVVRDARRDGFSAFLGNTTDVNVLKSAKVADAAAVLVTHDQPRAAEHLCAILRQSYPHLCILSRARDQAHVHRLHEAGATAAVPENLEASLQLTARLLETLAIPSDEVSRLLYKLRRDDYAFLTPRLNKAATERA